MSENDHVLTRNQGRALSAVLASRSVPDAAKRCGLSEKTIYRYLKTPSFRMALKSAQVTMLEETWTRLMHGQGKALDVLEDMLSAEGVRDNDRRNAAVSWMAISLKWMELLDLEQRVAALEAARYERNTA